MCFFTRSNIVNNKIKQNSIQQQNLLSFWLLSIDAPKETAHFKLILSRRSSQSKRVSLAPHHFTYAVMADGACLVAPLPSFKSVEKFPLFICKHCFDSVLSDPSSLKTSIHCTTTPSAMMLLASWLRSSLHMPHAKLWEHARLSHLFL